MIKQRLIYWITGTLTAFLGVLAVKILSPHLEKYSLFLMLTGYSLAIAGLFVITLGTKRKEPEQGPEG